MSPSPADPEHARRIAHLLGRASIAGCLLAALALVAWAGWRLVWPTPAAGPAPARPDAETLRVLARAYPGWSAADVEHLMRESWLRPYAYEPFTQFTEGPLKGRYVNVDPAGFRWSSPQCAWPPDPSCDPVFVFGGSTTFGYGLPDADTVPSRLQELLVARGGQRRPCVYNFGRGFYYSSQETVLFERLLVAGLVPRVAVFVDGLNDFLYEHDAPKFTEQLARHVAAINVHLDPVRGLTGGGRGAPASPPSWPVFRDRPGPPVKALERYARNRRAATAVGQAFGVQAAFVWQPVPVHGCDLAGHPFADRVRQAPWAQAVRDGYERAAAGQRAGGDPDLLWCADVQASSEPCDYLDAVHYSPALARRVAGCVAAKLAWP